MLLESTITPKKGRNDDKAKTKITSIAHAVIAATRPNSFRSSLQIGLGALIHRKYGSKDLLDTVSATVFCCSYNEVRLFKISCLKQPVVNVTEQNWLTQFIFDNADVNINTIDGNNTFHAMGGIQCTGTTPESLRSNETIMERAKQITCEATIGEFGKNPVTAFQKSAKSYLSDIEILNLDEKLPSLRIKPLYSDFMWMFGKRQGSLSIPGWNGFMEKVTVGESYSKSGILCLPFINAQPTSYDTIYSALIHALSKCK